MKDTGIYVNATPPALAAHGYAVHDGVATTPIDWDMSWAGGAGAIYSTVNDLFRWTEALHGGRVVNADSLKAMTTPNPLPAEIESINYGFGLVGVRFPRACRPSGTMADCKAGPAISSGCRGRRSPDRAG